MGSSGPSSVKQTTTTQLPAWLQPYAQQFMQTAQQAYYPGGQLTPYPYPTQQIAPFSDLQQMGLGQIGAMGTQNPLVNLASNVQGGVMGSLPGYMGAANQAIGNMQNLAGQTYNPMLSAIQGAQGMIGGGGGMNPYLDAFSQAAARSMVGEYQTAVDPGIKAGALQAGAFGGTGMQEAESAAQQNLGSALSDLNAKIYEPAWAQGQQNVLQAMGMMPGLTQGLLSPQQQIMAALQPQQAMGMQSSYMAPYLMQAGYYPSQQLMQYGGTQQQQLQQILNAQQQAQYGAAGWPFTAIQGLGQALGLAMGSGGVSTVNMPTTGMFGPFVA